MSENLNRILGELEEDLKKLQSAREQVERVVQSNTEFANSANSLVNDTHKLVEGITKSTLDAVTEFTEKLNESKSSIDTVVTQSISRLEEIAKQIGESVKDVSIIAKSSIEEQKNENLKALNQLLETQNQIKKLIGELLNLELPSTLKNINANLQKLNEENNVQFKNIRKDQILIFVGLGVLMIVILVLKFLN